MDAAETTELARQLRLLHHGDHSCLLYETAAEQCAAMVPFFVEGLARGERCLWITDDRSADEVKSQLFEAGIDVGAEERRGAFLFQTKRETYLRDGAFEPHCLIGMLADTLHKTAEAGFTGLRGSGEMTWALGGDPGSERAIEYEALLNDFIPGKPFVAICQYNVGRFVPDVVLEVLRTHPYAVLGDLVCPNLYFEPTAMVLGATTETARLAWRVQQLRRAREASHTLERAVAARDAFVAVASHELKTPLAALQLQLEMLADSLHAQGHAAERRRVERALAQTQRLDELAERLLDVTHLRACGLSLAREPLDLAAIVRAVAERLAPLAAKAGCSVDLALESVHGEWDRARLEEVVTNLLTNAFKFAAGKAVYVATSRDDRSAILTVADDGIGIAEADHERVFGPFERAVSEKNYGGFGLGLWVVRQIVEAHRGSVGVDSESGRGATFTVRLPARDA